MFHKNDLQNVQCIDIKILHDWKAYLQVPYIIDLFGSKSFYSKVIIFVRFFADVPLHTA